MRMTVFLGLLCAVFLGCKKIDKFTQFNMPYDETVEIPSSTGINLPFDVLSPEIETNAESTFASNDTRKDLIEEIKLTKLDLTVISPSSSDFSFLKSVEIYLNANGLAETKIAWKEDIPADVGSYISLSVSQSDLKEYIKKDKFSIRVNTVTDEYIAQDHQINVHSNFFVDAKILGQ